MKRFSGTYSVLKSMIFVFLFFSQSIYSFADTPGDNVPEILIDQDSAFRNMICKPAVEQNYNQIVEIRESFNADGEWTKKKIISNYDDNMSLIEYFFLSWIDEEWIETSWTSNIYNDQGKSTDSHDYTMIDGEWVESSKDITVFDENGDKSEWHSQIFIDGEWVNDRKITYTCDEHGNVEEVITEVWEDDKWNSYSQSNYTYDDQGNMTESLSGTIYEGEMRIMKEINTYDDQEQLVEILFQNLKGDDFFNLYANFYSYDVHGHQIERLIKKWISASPDSEEGEWTNNSKYTSIYNDQGLKTESLNQYMTNGEWEDNSRSFYTYDYITHIAGNSSEMPSEIILSTNYPNPFNMSTTIEFLLPETGFADLVIFNIMGQKVRNLLSEHMTQGVHSIIWDGCDNQGEPLTTGIYFSRLTTRNSYVNGRMMLMK